MSCSDRSTEIHSHKDLKTVWISNIRDRIFDMLSIWNRMVGSFSGEIRRCPEKVREFFNKNEIQDMIFLCIHDLLIIKPPLDEEIKDSLILLEKDLTEYIKYINEFFDKTWTEFLEAYRSGGALQLKLFLENNCWFLEYKVNTVKIMNFVATFLLSCPDPAQKFRGIDPIYFCH